ncbi:MAG: hypothetical protein ACKPKO_61200, partial [Candidatus Fonsibacter sp.]
LSEGDKSMVQIMTSAAEDSKSNHKYGTLYTLAKPSEKKAAQKGASLTITAYGKLMPEGVAGKHAYTFEFPEGHANHKGMDYFLASKFPGKAGSKTTSSGNFFSPP